MIFPLECARELLDRLRRTTLPMNTELMKMPRLLSLTGCDPIVVQLGARHAKPVEIRASCEPLNFEIEHRSQEIGIDESLESSSRLGVFLDRLSCIR